MDFGWLNLLYIFNGMAIGNLKIQKMADQFLTLISTTVYMVGVLTMPHSITSPFEVEIKNCLSIYALVVG